LKENATFVHVGFVPNTSFPAGSLSVIRARRLLSAGFAVFVFLTGCGPTRERAAFDPAFVESMCKKLDGVWAGTREDTDRRTLGTFVLTLKCDGRTLSASYEGTIATEMGPRPFSNKAINVAMKSDGVSFEAFTSSDRILYYDFSLEGGSLIGTSEGSEANWFHLKKRP
jgi:hypothetical protein